MSLRNILAILWRHKLLMAAVILVTMAAVPLRLMTAQSEYTGTVKLLVTLPEQTSVNLLSGGIRPATPEEEINIARNNFVDVLDSGETRRRVIEALNLPAPLQNYKLGVHVSRDTDFLTIDVTTIDSQWAAQIANEHVAQARQYFGEIRAQPAALAKKALAAQVSEANTQLAKAEQDLVDFKNQYHISSIDAEHTLAMTALSNLYNQRYQTEVSASGSLLTQAFPDLIKSLDAQRGAASSRNDFGKAAALDTVMTFVSGQIQQYTADTTGQEPMDRLTAIIAELEAQRQAANAAGQKDTADSYAYVIAFYSGQLLTIKQANNSLAVINQQIADQEAQIAQLNEITPQYNGLQVQVDQARTNFQSLSTAYQDAVIKEETATRADFIQVVLPASVFASANRSLVIGWIAFGLVASVGVAIVLAFFAELLGRWLWPAAPALETTMRSKALERRG
jgi:uncharacterized protein involved in exopolysaccharide biosynthesis